MGAWDGGVRVEMEMGMDDRCDWTILLGIKGMFNLFIEEVEGAVCRARGRAVF